MDINKLKKKIKNIKSQGECTEKSDTIIIGLCTFSSAGYFCTVFRIIFKGDMLNVQ